jgi:hypothetical protein
LHQCIVVGIAYLYRAKANGASSPHESSEVDPRDAGIPKDEDLTPEAIGQQLDKWFYALAKI